ncbi:MAG: hypothetical protein HC799_17430 [Limnothrix sp. RL_2_0]|nr:hypothetical protein [Limnothrix sp. RL_2_0]
MAASKTTETGVTPASVANIPPLDKSKGLSGAALCRRFSLEKSAISAFERRNGVNSEAFKEWSAAKDPEGLSWYREGEGRKTKYFPVVSFS